MASLWLDVAKEASENLQLDICISSPAAAVCSNHFAEEDFINSYANSSIPSKKRPKLKDSAVPQISLALVVPSMKRAVVSL